MHITIAASSIRFIFKVGRHNGKWSKIIRNLISYNYMYVKECEISPLNFKINRIVYEVVTVWLV